MFAATKAFSGFAVDDLRAAQTFYGDTLGLRTSIVDHHGLFARALSDAGRTGTRREFEAHADRSPRHP